MNLRYNDVDVECGFWLVCFYDDECSFLVGDLDGSDLVVHYDVLWGVLSFQEIFGGLLVAFFLVEHGLYGNHGDLRVGSCHPLFKP